MEAPIELLRRKQQRVRQRRTWMIVGAAVSVILVIVVPLAIELQQQRLSKHVPLGPRPSQGLPSLVLLPLYIYPAKDAWDPLYATLDQQSDVNFTIIVNIQSGPGPSRYPDTNFLAAIQKLNRYDNVRTVGYVRTGYATREISSVLGDIAAFSTWGYYKTKDPARSPIAMHGIFFDETPNEYTSDAATYLKNINQAAKSATGILPDRIVIHNPGTLIDPRLDDSSTDINVIFEGPYTIFLQNQSTLMSSSFDRSRSSYLIHSVPNMAFENLGTFVDEISENASALFITDLTRNYYNGFGSRWQDFIDVIPI